MKIIQLVPTLSYGDAVSNDILALNGLLHKLGIETEIYALEIGAHIPAGTAVNFHLMPKLMPEDILLYHMATGCNEIANFLLHCECRKILVYHNITPSHFFSPYAKNYVTAVQDALKELILLKETFECCIADSEFNKQDLRKAGYTCPIAVLPILVPFEDYQQEPDADVLSRYKDAGWTNILFVGRIAPNKCQEDVIASFAAYKEKYNAKSRLFIVGNYNGMEAYFERLQQYVAENHVKDVVFTGHITFKAIIAYYNLADVFLCMSEHEGFCVPLLEAMKFEVPIVAYESTAIPYTLNDAGIIVNEKNPIMIASIINEIVCNDQFRNQLLVTQNKRLSYFQYGNVAKMAENIILRLVNREDIEPLETQRMIDKDRVAGKRSSLLSQIEIQSSILDQNQITKEWVPLSQIPVPKVSAKQVRTEEPRQSILFRCYRLVHSIAPGLADFIRSNLKN